MSDMRWIDHPDHMYYDNGDIDFGRCYYLKTVEGDFILEFFRSNDTGEVHSRNRNVAMLLNGVKTIEEIKSLCEHYVLISGE